MPTRTPSWLILFIGLGGCGAGSDMEAPPSELEDRFVTVEAVRQKAADTGGPRAGAPPPPAAGRPMPKRAMGSRAMKEEASVAPSADEAPGAPALEPAPEVGGEAGPDLRAWFPETFLWAPRVVTDAQGRAELTVEVPDSLTTWRVLGLAASREGAQTGEVLRFSSTLPVYVDPVVPEWLRAGDALDLPVQVVNTTAEAAEAALVVEATGLSGAARGQVRLGPYATAVERVRVSAREPGPASVTATLTGSDAVRRAVEVEPVGRPLVDSRAGVLGSEDAVTLTTPPGATYARARVVLYPGPLGLVRAELGAAGARSGQDLSSLAYAFALAVDAPALVASLGAPEGMTDAEALRALRLSAQQGLVRHLRSPSPADAATALRALARAPDDPVARRMAERLEGLIRDAQLPDGTWPVAPGATVQALVARTAWVAGATDDRGVRVLSSGAVERFAARLTNPETGDAYTAALVLDAGLAEGPLAEGLRALILASLSPDGGGQARVRLPPGVVGPGGTAPSAAEVEAVCARALGGAEGRELSAALLARYQPGRGFGDGLASLAALDALAMLGSEAPPEVMDVVLKLDGEEVERHVLRREAAAEVAVLTVPAPLSGSHRYELVADGAWPGLAWHLDLEARVPWEGGAGPRGLEVALAHGPLFVGRPAPFELKASAPSGEALTLSVALPVGFIVDEASVVGAEVARLTERELVLEVAGDHGGMADVRFSATPTFSGSLNTGPTVVALARQPDLAALAPPQRWEVRP